MTMLDAFATSPALLIASVFILSLLVGSFLNVVIHRLPIMLDREWRAQAREMLAEPDDPLETLTRVALPGFLIRRASRFDQSLICPTTWLCRAPPAPNARR
jgi:prepilin signal peptidase PulO-like enzyme (type II secretory pathway)